MESPALEATALPKRSLRNRRFLFAGVAVLLVVFLLLAIVAICFRYAALAALPQLDGTIHVAGLGSPVTVLRDAHGVPAITAASLDDLFFAQGYVTAQDRLWQMDMTRRFAAGELAEVLGSGYVKQDIAQRILGLRQAAEGAASRLPSRERGYFEAYVRGVNAYLAARTDSLPLEFRVLRYAPRPWTPADSFLVGGLMSEMLNQHSQRDELVREKVIARLGPELTADLFPVTTGRDILPDGGRRPAPAADGQAEPESQTQPPGPHAGQPLHRKTGFVSSHDSGFVSGHDFSRAAGDHEKAGFSPCAFSLWQPSNAGAKALNPFWDVAARLKSCPDTTFSPSVVLADTLKVNATLSMTILGSEKSGLAGGYLTTARCPTLAPCSSAPGWAVLNPTLAPRHDSIGLNRLIDRTFRFFLKEGSWRSAKVGHPQRLDDENPAFVPGSNNWVLSGAHTASGKPLLANDMHLPHRIPNTWYEVHLTVEAAPTADAEESSGAYDVAGVSLPGVPCVIVGHNRRIAWGFTNLGPDVQDLYVETFNQRGEYLTPQGWQRPEVRHEVIRVKHGRDRAIDVVVTRHGPIITPALRAQQEQNPRLPGARESRQLALRWTLYDAAAAAFLFFDLNTAGNWEEFRRALSHMASPAQNVVYADVDGHIGYQATGLIPIRAAGDGSLPVDGSDDAHEWTGYIPFDELPWLFDPPSGIIATANNRITADDYPYLITTDWGGPYRAERIHHVLHSDKKFTRADMLALENDIYSDLDRFLAERFVYAVDHWPQASTRARQAAALLRQWDGRMAADSAAAAIERHARSKLYETLLKAKLGDDAKQYAWMNSGAWLEDVVLHSPASWLPPAYGSYEELLSAMVEKAVSGPEAPGNLAAWRYGRDFPVEIAHPLFGKVPVLKRWAGPGRQPQSGSGDTVKQVGRAFGPSERMTVDFADFDASTLNLVDGQSGNLFSPYFDDQWPAWYAGTSFALPFSKAAVEGSAAHRLTLEPF